MIVFTAIGMICTYVGVYIFCLGVIHETTYDKMDVPGLFIVFTIFYLVATVALGAGWLIFF